MSAMRLSVPARRIRPIAVVAAAAAIVVGSYGIAAFRAPTSVANPPAPAAPAAGADDGGQGSAAAIGAPGAPLPEAGSIAYIDHSISLWLVNVQNEPRDYISLGTLGTLYEGRARLTGDIADYARAQQDLAQALAIEPADVSIRMTHARILASLHDFGGALAEARAILRDDPTQLPALATEGDAELELGDVAGAATAYTALAAAAPGPAVDARLSRLAFIQGRPDDAWRLAQRAYDEAEADGQSGPSLSWYAYVLGTLSLPAGRPADALAWFGRARTAWPQSYLAAAGLARAEAAVGRTADAIRDASAAIAISPQPDALALLGDLYALQGNAKLADQQYATVEAIGHLAAVNQQVFNRQLVLFSVNHDRDLAQALSLAQNEIAIRKDAYGYDALAWALLANGRAAEAQVAINQAQAFGTVDPLFEYHAGLIAQALGQRTTATALLQAALAQVGGLDPLATDRATAALADLEGTR